MAQKFSVEAIFSAIDRMSAPVRKMHERIEEFSKGLGDGLKKIDTFNARVSSGIKAAAGAATAAMGSAAFIGKQIVDAGASFEQAITNVGAVSLMTRDQIGSLEAKAKALGESTKFSATQVAEGMELMAKAGFTNAEILQGIEGVLNAAAAEGADLAEVSGHVSNVLKGMGLAAGDATRVADVLTLASSRTNSSISSLGASMSNVASTARQFKIPLEEVVGGVALLQDVGLDASVAGSALNTMLTQLAAPSKNAAQQMRALGVRFQDAKGNMLPLMEVFQNMATATRKSGGNMKQVAFFAELVGLRGQKAAQNLADLFASGKVEALNEELKNAAGSAEKMANLRMDTLRGDLLILESALEGVKIELFDMNSGPLRDILQSATEWIGKNKELITSKFREYVVWLIDNLPKIVDTMKSIGKAVVAFYAFSTAVKAAKIMIEAYEAAVALTKASQWLLTTSIKGTAAAMRVGKVAAIESAAALKLFNKEAAAGQTGLAGLRTGLNASELGKQINGITSKLGRAGLLGAALAVGYAFGTWLNETFKLNEKINDLIEKIRGVEKNRAKDRGLDTKGDQILGDGTVKAADGTIKKYGTGAESAGKRFDTESRTAFKKNQDELRKVRMTPLMRKAFNATAERVGIAPITEPQIASPEERIARSVVETKSTTKAEVTIKDQTGRAEVTKQPNRGSVGLKVQPTGAL
jgi:TP901 family phage tail tape measure protein